MTYKGIADANIQNNIICLSGSLYPDDSMSWAYVYEFSTDQMGLCDETYIIGGEDDEGDEENGGGNNWGVLA